jgi:hypothetical protein
MLTSAVVVDEADFAVWQLLQRHRADAGRVWEAFSAGKLDEAALAAAVAAYLERGDDAGRRFALRWWLAADLASSLRRERTLAAEAAARRATLDRLIDARPAPERQTV